MDLGSVLLCDSSHPAFSPLTPKSNYTPRDPGGAFVSFHIFCKKSCDPSNGEGVDLVRSEAEREEVESSRRLLNHLCFFYLVGFCFKGHTRSM